MERRKQQEDERRQEEELRRQLETEKRQLQEEQRRIQEKKVRHSCTLQLKKKKESVNSFPSPTKRKPRRDDWKR